MSGNAAKSKTAAKKKSVKADRRVVHTRDILGDALITLMHEKPFDEITVQQVLDRAGVSRSTFYTHYRDKDDLFLSDVEDFLSSVCTMLSRRDEKSNRVAPVRELFAHIAEWRPFHSVLVANGKIHDFLELAQGHFARAIEQRLSEVPPGQAIPPMQRAAQAQMYSGALISLLSWWMAHGTKTSPTEMDEIFHRMVWTGAQPPST